MSFEISYLDRQSIKPAATLMAHVYRDDPSVLAFLDNGSSVEKTERLLRHYFTQLLSNGICYGKVLSSWAGSELCGVAIFYPPGTYPLPRLASLKTIFRLFCILIPVIGVQKFRSLVNFVSVLSRNHPKKPHYYAEIGCVALKYQRSGIVKAFAKKIFELADRDQVGVYGETSNPENIPIWQKVGYQIIGESQISNISCWSLWREPKIPAEL